MLKVVGSNSRPGWTFFHIYLLHKLFCLFAEKAKINKKRSLMVHFKRKKERKREITCGGNCVE